MNFTTLLLATEFALGWSKWFTIGLSFGAVVMVIVGIVTIIQSKKSADQDTPQSTSEQSNEEIR